MLHSLRSERILRPNPGKRLNSPPGSLSGAVFGVADSTVTNLQGVDLTLKGDLAINGILVPSLPTMIVANGTRIVPVTKVLVPPAH